MNSEEKENIESKIKALREVMSDEKKGADEIKKATEELSQAFYNISTRLYQQYKSGDADGKAESKNTADKENVIDADYTVNEEK